MNKNLTSAVTGVAVGMAVGTAAYMMSGTNRMHGQSRKLKKSASKAIKNAGVIIDSVSHMMH